MRSTGGSVRIIAGMSDSPAPAILDWSRIDHVLLDMDGTVLDLAYDNRFWQHELPLRYAEHHGISAGMALERLGAAFAATHGTLDWYCLDYWSRFTGLDIAAIKRTPEHRARMCPLPGSDDFLRAVRASGRPLWLVTNAHPGSWTVKLEQTGIGLHFDRIISAHDFGLPKEHPAFWPTLMQRHPFAIARALFADDSLNVLRNAQASGFAEVVAIRHPDSSAAPRSMPGFTAVDRLPGLLPIGPLAR